MSFKDKFWLMLKFLLMNFYFQIDWFVMQIAKEYDQKGKKLLDIGAGGCPYKKYFKNLTYKAQDIKQNQTQTINYVMAIERIPEKNFDYILCTQVLEHLKEPKKAFREFNHLLKPGGKLFLTTNFIYQIHMEPNDYYRFTEYGLRYLGEASGFVLEKLRAQGGVFGVLAYVLVTLPLRLGLEQCQFIYWLYLILFSPLIMSLNLMAFTLDLFDRKKRLTVNYEVVFRKKP
jgi:SAM-dependent methyltransferase